MPQCIVHFTGLIDVVYSDNGDKVILDWKTTTSHTIWPDSYKGSYQGIAYAFLTRAIRSEFCKLQITVHDEQPDRAYVYSTGDYDLSVNNYTSVNAVSEELASIIHRLLDFCKDKPEILRKFRANNVGSRYAGKTMRGGSTVKVEPSSEYGTYSVVE